MSPTYWYEGRCPQSSRLLRLPRTAVVEAIAHNLMHQLASDDRYALEGKMYGVLLLETPSGEQQVLKAFSGLLNGESVVEGWVPPIPGRERVALEEAQTLVNLETIKQELLTLQQRPDRKQYESLTQEFETRLQQLARQHQQRKQERQHQRQTILETLQGDILAIALEQLNEQSQRDGIERRHLKRQRDSVLQPLKHCLDQLNDRIHTLKQQRKELSRQLQAQMHANYWLTNFAGRSLPLQALMPHGAMPTGTGDCCAPKLLHFAATQGFKPLAMAEFWWGPASSDGTKVQGAFYGACAERCQPLMGFLLSGMTEFSPYKTTVSPAIKETESSRNDSCVVQDTLLTAPLLRQDLSVSILYIDDWLIVVDKPAGLLSVPGRYADRQDSVLNRLRYGLPDGVSLLTVHRLDQETSGILLLARDPQTHRHLSQQFQQRTVHKVYEAVLSGIVEQTDGVIDLPLWGNPCARPYQTVDWQRGKPSITRFQVMVKENLTRVAFFPLTGRTHQIRVHAADPAGLGVPILGDRLYGCRANADRLHLHARELRFEHPQTGQTLHLKSPVRF